jgi:hypothetical protein
MLKVSFIRFFTVKYIRSSSNTQNDIDLESQLITQSIDS